MTWNGKRVLVTGAGGFIGSHLAERLVELGANVRAFVHYNSAGSWGWLDDSSLKSEMEMVSGDICDRGSVAQAVQDCGTVFHLAALIAIPYSYIAPASYVQTNIVGTLNVLEAARQHAVSRVIHTSTSEVYGTAREIPINERHPLQGQSPYSATKIAADKLAESYHLSFGVPVVTVRPFNTFGPRQSARAIIPTIISQALKADVVRLGSLSPTRDLNFVRNTVEGFIRAAEPSAAIGQTFNLGSGNEISIGDLAQRIIMLCQRSITIQCDEQRLRPTNSEVHRLIADSSLATNVLGWRPAISFDDGLLETIAWVRANLGRFRTELYNV